MNLSLFHWFLLLNAAFIIGITVVTFAEYSTDKRIRHIMCVAGSHIILTILVVAAIIWHVFITNYSWLATGVAVVAFGMSDYAILWMLKHRRYE